MTIGFDGPVAFRMLAGEKTVDQDPGFSRVLLHEFLFFGDDRGEAELNQREGLAQNDIGGGAVLPQGGLVEPLQEVVPF